MQKFDLNNTSLCGNTSAAYTAIGGNESEVYTALCNYQIFLRQVWRDHTGNSKLLRTSIIITNYGKSTKKIKIECR